MFNTASYKASNFSALLTHSYCKKMNPQSLLKSSFGLGDRESQDYESFHFVEDEIEQEFYAAPAPSEDIWKKFELIPTPPRSPRRDDEDDTDVLDMVDGIFSPKSTTEKLQLVSEILDDPMSQTIIASDFFSKCAACSPNIKSKLIQDCMWSGNLDNDAGDEKVEEKSSEKKPSLTEISSNTECVDPSSVFPYPINDSAKKKWHVAARKESLGVETPSESEDNDNEYDDDGDDDDDDEEIDVVTVEGTKKKYYKRRPPTAQIVPSLKIKVKALSVPPQSTAVAPLHKSVHNYSMKRKSLSLPASPQPSAKKLKRELSVQDFKSTVNKFHNYPYDGRSNRSSASDSEDCEEKRAQHNVLERQRRNDLKYSFFHLRDQVPELHRQERAPKVMILKKASDYIIKLRREHRRLELLRQAEEKKQEQLERRLEDLQRTCYY